MQQTKAVRLGIFVEKGDSKIRILCSALHCRHYQNYTIIYLKNSDQYEKDDVT